MKPIHRASHTDTQRTSSLLARIRGGDSAAREELLHRYLGLLRKWAHGRVPAAARGEVDTDDLVQKTMLKVVEKFATLRAAETAAFLAFLQTVLLNQIRDEARKAARRPRGEAAEDTLQSSRSSPLQDAVAGETLERYTAALGRMTPVQQRAVVLRVELGNSFKEIAQQLEMPSANSARMVVTRALQKIASEIATPTD